MSSPCLSNHASANWADVQFLLSARFLHCLAMSTFFCLLAAWNLGMKVGRMSFGSRGVLLAKVEVRMPLPSGMAAMMAIPR